MKTQKNKMVITAEEQQTLLREQRITDFSAGRVDTAFPKLSTKSTFGMREPNTSHLGDRSPADLTLTWKPFADRVIDKIDLKDAGKVLDPKSSKIKFKKNADYVGTYHNYNGILKPEYDMLEAFVIYDTEIYVKQSINRKLALMFRNGWEVISDLESDMEQSTKNTDYIYKRLSTMEYIMDETTESFFKRVLFNLLLCSNCFLRKIRDEDGAGVPKKSGPDAKIPLAGFQIVPAHTILPYLEKGVIKHWRRFYDTGTPWEDFSLEEIIHLKWDVKPGHIYGTPRTVGVRDDIFALRRLEENIELLFINHLFPLFHVKVGTEKAPCTYGPNGESEIDIVKYQIETMPKEGVFVTDERMAVDIVGAEGKSLETQEILQHLKARVFTGMGVSSIDMGEGQDATRATADNISQNLKDLVKADMDAFGGMLRMRLFKEWFTEANYSLSVQKAVATTFLQFHEIDMDNKIKEENHIINKYNSHLVTGAEARKQMKTAPLTKEQEKDTHYNKHVVDLVKQSEKAKADNQIRVATEPLPELEKHQSKMTGHAIREMEAQGSLEKVKSTAHVAKAEASTKLTKAKAAHAAIVGASPTGATKKATPSGKTTKTRSQPTNQHKTNPGPTRAKSSREEFLELLKDELLLAKEQFPTENWETLSAKTFDSVLDAYDKNHPQAVEDQESCYTNQIREGALRMKAMLSQTSDPEMLAILLDVGFEPESIDDRSTEMELDSADSAEQATISESTISSGDPESIDSNSSKAE